MFLSQADGAELSPLTGIKTWQNPAKSWKTFGTGDFKAFLPPDEKYYENLGLVYYLIQSPEEMKKGPSLSSNRYLPPKVADHDSAAQVIHRLLSMFHENVFVISRFAPQGSVACVRAINKDYIDISFR